MPGIFGFYDSHNRDFLEQTQNKLQTNLVHTDQYSFHLLPHTNYLAGFTAPYKKDDGLYFDKGSGLLINFEGRLDYYLDDDGNKFPVIKGTETKILSNLFLKYDRRTPHFLSGVYNVAIFNTKTQRLFLFNDILANQILFYFGNGETFIYGTELKIFLSYPGFSPKMDPSTAADLWNFFRIWGDKSLYEGVKTLPAGSCLERTECGISLEQYFASRQTNEYRDRKSEEIIDEGWDLFQQSIDRSIAGKKSVSIPISGGIDSRLILSVAKSKDIGISPFTFADSPKCLEYEIAKKVTSSLNLAKHKFLLINPDNAGRDLVWSAWLNDGMELASTSYHLDLVSKMCQNSEGVLNGIFGGHLSFSDGFYFPEYDHTNFSSEKKLAIFSDLVKARGRSVFRERPQSGIFTKQYSTFLYDSARETLLTEFAKFQENSDNLSEQIISYIRSVLLRNMMNRKDIHRFFHKDELVFGDPDLFRYSLKVPNKIKENNHIYYGMIRKHAPDLIHIPTIHTGERQVRNKLDSEGHKESNRFSEFRNKALYYAGRLSLGKINRYDKFSYKHYNQWYRNSRVLRETMEELLLQERTLARDHLNPGMVKKIVNKQRTGGEYYESLMLLIQIELFYRFFVEGDPIPQAPDEHF